MKKWKFFRKAVPFIMLLALLMAETVYAAEETDTNNRFNVVIATDASNSINYTDPNRLRDIAMEQFIGLLAEQGNTLGGVVFSTNVEAAEETSNIDNEDAKEKYTKFFKGANTYSYTNIGAALEKSVSMIEEKGKKELPSVIVLLSDGNTEMPTEEEQTASLDAKAEAIQKARDNGIKIYSVCLNANNKADTSEMKQISEATGGAFEEVKNADDLKAVFNNFYDLIYGTATIILIDDVFPASGILEEPFSVPGIGVEEVNIVVNGQSEKIELEKPDGNKCSKDQMSVNKADTFSLVKIKNVEPGDWKLIIHGEPGTQVKVNMVYNTNLVVDVTGPVTGEAYTNEESTITAQLRAGDMVASTREQYTGYEAVLEICDMDEKVIETKPMELGDTGYTVNYQFGNGLYYYRVRITGNYLEKTSKLIGPLSVTSEKPETVEPEETKEPENTPPKAVEDRVKNVVYVWPFKGGSTEINLKDLAKDKEDKELNYKIISSSFLEGTDYEVKNDVIKQDHFSLSRGSYTVRAMDSGGLTCEIEVEVISRNVGVMAMIGVGIIGLIVLIVALIGLYIALTKPFGGPIYVQGHMNGEYSDKVKKEKRRGRCKLSMFGLPASGLNYAQCYFQATGQNFIYLVTKTPVFYSGRLTNKVQIESGAETVVSVDKEGTKLIYIRYESRFRKKHGAPKGMGGGMGGGFAKHRKHRKLRSHQKRRGRQEPRRPQAHRRLQAHQRPQEHQRRRGRQEHQRPQERQELRDNTIDFLKEFKR